MGKYVGLRYVIFERSQQCRKATNDSGTFFRFDRSPMSFENKTEADRYYCHNDIWFNRVLRTPKLGKTPAPGFEELTEVRTMLAETVKELHRQWKREGLEEGRKEGQVNLLLKQLELKFGLLSDKVRSRIHDADDEKFSIWGERILTAQTLLEFTDTLLEFLLKCSGRSYTLYDTMTIREAPYAGGEIRRAD